MLGACARSLSQITISLGWPILFRGEADAAEVTFTTHASGRYMTEEEEAPRFDRATAHLSKAIGSVDWPPTVTRAPTRWPRSKHRAGDGRAWACELAELAFTHGVESEGASSDDTTRYEEGLALRACVYNAGREMARQFRDDGRGDVVVRVDFDDGTGCGSAVAGFPPPKNACGLQDDERGDLYVVMEAAEGEEDYDVEDLLGDDGLLSDEDPVSEDD